jgi:hypothetical protein
MVLKLFPELQEIRNKVRSVEIITVILIIIYFRDYLF